MKENVFVKVAPPNKETLAKLLKDAKGPARTMKQFAAECGASQSGFSRIVHGSYKGALADEVIKTIAEHADPDSKVTYDMLMGANGMARILDSSTVYLDTSMDVEKSFVNVVLSDLERSGALVSYENGRTFQVGTTFKFQTDLLVRVKPEGMDSSRIWGFEIISPQVHLSEKNQDGNMSSHEASTRRYGQRFIESMGRILPLFYGKKIDKFSFVITDRKVFDYLVSEYAENYPVPFELSFILYDAGRKVIEEEVAVKQVK